ncbi:YifB family Mg chelatase-like AAA ATPase [candidate division FCPU426 bacterium]|nr:YifB family Mg chelatase-like AAA ATPase [candidate division FCPU426 bacterium]
MYAQVLSSALWGISAKVVTVEVDVSRGLPAFNIVGLPDAAVKESRDRVLAALKNTQFLLPARRITVNLAPAHLRKEGPAYDLPIALGLLAANGYIPPQALAGHLFFGELSLDGRICPVRGALSLLAAAQTAKIERIILPAGNAREVGLTRHLVFFPMGTLLETVDFFLGKTSPQPYSLDHDEMQLSAQSYDVDFSEVRSQVQAKRALEVAAAGAHNVLMIGPPGSGKTMLAHRLPTILPPPNLTEALETTKIYSIAGLLPPENAFLNTRPFRSPHHTVSDVALIGGGSYPRPGEVSLAHNGVLFLDELPEFNKNALEVLRQPLEENKVTISRTAAAVTYPAHFMLLAAMNPCPCGYFTDPDKACNCSSTQIQRYLAKISGPLLDRFDLHLEVPAVRYQELAHPVDPEPSLGIRERVLAARAIQKARYHAHTGMHANSCLTPRFIRHYCRLHREGQNLLRDAIEKLGLSARAFHRILKVARTLADLDACEDIQLSHISEAVHYRTLDKRYWGKDAPLSL